MEKFVHKKHPLPKYSEQEVKPLDEEEELPKGGNKVVGIVFVVLIVCGIGTGYVLSRKVNATPSQTGNGTTTQTTGNKSVGVDDAKTFKDSATGTIEQGGLAGEGTHQLVREGGPSQTVYLISSIVDLDQFVGKKVTVWGQTMDAKKVSWLMDVGRVDSE